MNVLSCRLDRKFEMFRDEFMSSATRVLSSGKYVFGSETEKLEKRLLNYVDKKDCATVKNGTDALYIAMKCLGIGTGDEVLVPCNTFVADFASVKHTGAEPIAVDVNAYFNIDASSLQGRITAKTKAILVVHLYGQAADMDQIRDIACRNNLFIIEDCAQAFGTKYKGISVGSFGEAACFSFYPTKNLGAFGDGGAILTDNAALDENIRTYRYYGINSSGKYASVGINSRIDELQAAILNVQLNHIHELLGERERIANRYLSEIQNEEIVLPKTAVYSNHTFHQFVIQCNRRDELKLYLEQRGIQTQVHYNNPAFRSELYLPKTDRPLLSAFSTSLCERILSLPMYYGMTDDEITYVIDSINSFGRMNDDS